MPIRILAQTEQTWVTEPGSNDQIYNTPTATGETLDYRQGKVNVILNNTHILPFLGTCGLVSCVNVLRLAGRMETTEEEVLKYALYNRLCKCTMNPYMNGGTSASSRQNILQGFGLESEVLEATTEDIAKYVSEGRGVIISVDAGILWEDSDREGEFHAITVTSVKKDPDGNILGFYICDSGSGSDDFARYCDADFLRRSLSGYPMNVTSAIIR